MTILDQDKVNEMVTKDSGYEKNMLYYPPVWADPEIYGMTAWVEKILERRGMIVTEVLFGCTRQDREKCFKFNKKEKGTIVVNGIEKTVEKDRKSYEGNYTADPIPKNPKGRTGMIGRGLLGQYGPNHAADPVVTWSVAGQKYNVIVDVTLWICDFSFVDSKKESLKIALIKRQDTKESAIPGVTFFCNRSSPDLSSLATHVNYVPLATATFGHDQNKSWIYTSKFGNWWNHLIHTN